MTRSTIATRVENISNVTAQRALVNDAIQWALERVADYFDWPYYMQSGVINTVATYTTGTVTATNGSTTVTGSGTTFTAAMVGRKIRFNNETAYYRIAAFVSVTSITLETPYQGTTASALTYTIYKDEYRLNADVHVYKTIIQIQNGVPMRSIPPAKFDRFFPAPFSYTDPTIEIMSGTKLDTYSTGTVSATISTNTITGSGTSWLSVEGLGRLSQIVIGSNVYTVKTLNSDTSITTYESIAATVTANAYTINLRNLIVEAYPIPDSQRNLYYRYFRKVDLLANDTDVPDMPTEWHYLLVYGALSFVFLQKGDAMKSQETAEARFLEGLQNMKNKLGSFASDRIWRRSSQDSYINIGDGLEKGTFDRKYSSP